MANGGVTRREILLCSSLSVGLGRGETSHQHQGSNSIVTPFKFKFFTADQAADVDSIAELIIPADETPGARKAGVVHFIDHALATFDQSKQPQYRAGLQDLKARIRELSPTATKVADLTADQQAKLMTALEQTELFTVVRTHTVMGFFGNESYGGNRDHIGWKIIGFEDKFAFRPPFGAYDAEGGSPSK